MGPAHPAPALETGEHAVHLARPETGGDPQDGEQRHRLVGRDPARHVRGRPGR